MHFYLAALAVGLQLPAALSHSDDQKQVGVGLGQRGPGNSRVAGKKPNIVFVLTDDQDLHLQSLDYLPLIKKYLTDNGTLYERHYCTTAVCCPSRVSLWTGKLAHNTNVTDVNPPYGGYPKFVSQGLNEAYLPLWLQQAGYDTYYTGKLFNAHTVDNYNAPFPAGWNGSDFLVDPYTYMYLNATFQRNQDPPVSYEGQYLSDVLAQKALGFLDDAAKNAHSRPFFLGIAPIAPHSNVNATYATSTSTSTTTTPDPDKIGAAFGPPIPAARHADLFQNVSVPRTPNFNPSFATGASWVRNLQPQTEENLAFNDHFYRQRLRALQSVDELVAGVVERLAEHGLLENTFIFYTSDNGFHIGQHRLQPGKACGFEEDINVPLIVRGPGVPKGKKVADVVTSHVDLTPTLLRIAGVDLDEREDLVLDGEAVPLTEGELNKARNGTRHEHVTVEYWGMAMSEGQPFGEKEQRWVVNNTYKALRIIGRQYNFYYAVWCNNEHELHDLTTDPYQLNNLLDASATPPATILGAPFENVIARLDALLLVLKSCKGNTCVRPWQALHPAGNVQNLQDALSSRFDSFYEEQQKKVSFDRCELGYLVDAEGPQFEKDGLVYREGVDWSEWV